MKLLHKTLALLSGFSIIIILLFTSIQAVAYWIPGYYRHEYSKYHVDSIVKVQMDDLLKVTDEMMEYLEGSREHLHDIKTTINGVPDVLFFNERESLHMKDVRDLFLNAVLIRRILLIFLLIFIVFIIITKGELLSLLSEGYLKAVAIFLFIFAILLSFIFRDFSSAFITFHHIFFKNDLWILNPATDNLIVIVPEGFFFDTAKYIGIIFVTSLLLLLLPCICFQALKKKRI